MIIITGGLGFIGSHLVEALNKKNEKDIIIVDDFTDGRKLLKTNQLKFKELICRDQFIESLEQYSNAKAIYHMGAISDTTFWDGNQLLKYNLNYSKALAHFFIPKKIPFCYASSASVYGNTQKSGETKLQPLNAYASSKYLFDSWAEENNLFNNSNVYGLRFFNVYGNKWEDHKDGQQSPVSKFKNEIKNGNKIKLFQGSKDIFRDFVYVEDTAAAMIECVESDIKSGIFDFGTGSPISFYDIAKNLLPIDTSENDAIETIEFPNKFLGTYQFFTKANLEMGKQAGLKSSFRSFENFCQNVLNNKN